MKVKVEKIEGSKAKLDIVLTKEEFNDILLNGLQSNILINNS